MGLIEDVATYLDSNSTRWAVGTSLFMNRMPTEPNRAACVVETPGQPPARAFQGGVSWEQARIQLTCRSTSSATARADIQAGWDLLEAVANQTLTSNVFLRISAVQSPFLLARDEQGRPVFGANFDVWRAP
jgi:hypothetical protein